MRKCIVTTSWDDGHQMDERLASMLLDYRLKGTFYFAKDWIENSGNIRLVKELDKNFEVGAHSLSHRSLTSISLADVVEETRGSREWLEKLVNHKVKMFCYPFGKYNDRIVELVKDAGFNGSRALNFEINLPKNPFVLGIGSHASNGSPLLRLKAFWKSRMPLKSLLDWGANSKLLFDYILENGGIWHLWGHSWEINANRDWKKLEEVFKHVSNRENVSYLENGQVTKLAGARARGCLNIGVAAL